MADTIKVSHFGKSLLQRHQLVWITADAWADWIERHSDLGNVEVVANWAHCGRPFIVRTSAFPDCHQRITLGLPLPHSLGRQRLSVDVPRSCFLRADAPPLLTATIGAVPISWQASLKLIANRTPGVRCFGSVAWQHLSGLDYLNATSDVDLLWPIDSVTQADALAAAIASLAQKSPMRIDGELVTPTGNAIQWSEWHSGAEQVLVKCRTGASIKSREQVFQ